jgi:hypothetical protein
MSLRDQIVTLTKAQLHVINPTYFSEAAQAAGVEVVNSLAYLVGLYEQKRITAERVLFGLAKITRRGTLRPEWIQSAVRIVSEIRRKGEN